MKKHLESVDKFIAKWKPRLLLDHVGLTVKLMDDDHPADGDDGFTGAEVNVNPRYDEAKIKVYPKLFKEPSAYQEVTLVHEMVHVITDPINDVLISAVSRGVLSDKKRKDLIEGLTEHIAKIAYKGYTRGHKTGGGGYHL